MRIVTYEREAVGRCGVLVDDRVLDAGELAAGLGRDPSELLSARRVVAAGPGLWQALDRAGREAAERGEGIAAERLVLRAPIEDPDKIVCLGLNYRDHAFAKFRNSLVGPRGEIVPPARTEAVDYEGELAIVIGRRAADVAAADALDHVAGVMAMNDVTARDVQHATSQWTAGKAIDTFAPCGPSLVFLDEIDDVQDLRIETRVNGVTVQDGTTANMIFGVAETVEFLSALMTLEPGDIVATGTPAGVGVSRDPQVLLEAGDLVEVEIEGIGSLHNRVAAPRGASPSAEAAGAAAAREV
jgi:2-keto-4-pentenoate hydratase/2-oxohepta-3-ene-1,7-dioic acid hydratase in catechol pathway